MIPGIVSELHSRRDNEGVAWRVCDETNWREAHAVWAGDWVVDNNRAEEFAACIRTAMDSNGQVVGVDGDRVSLRQKNEEVFQVAGENFLKIYGEFPWKSAEEISDGADFSISSAVALCIFYLEPARNSRPPKITAPADCVLWDPTATAAENIAVARKACAEDAMDDFNASKCVGKKLTEDFLGYCGGCGGLHFAIHIGQCLSSLKITANGILLIDLREKELQFLREVCFARRNSPWGIPFNVRIMLLYSVSVEVEFRRTRKTLL